MNIKPLGKLFAIFLFIFAPLFFTIPYVSADNYSNSTLSVSANITEPVASVEISPTNIDFGRITKGYSTNYSNITIKNTGDINVRVRPMFSSGDYLFNYLKFSTASCSSWSGISTWQSAIISHSPVYGSGNGEEYHFCMKLDLSDYNDSISSHKSSANITFWVMPVS